MTQSTDLPEGWIAHDGGECPVPLDSVVEIMCRGGGIDTGPARSWWWGRDPEARTYDLIAYKPEQPQYADALLAQREEKL